MSKTWHYKLVLLGDTAVGKSCLVVRFVRDEFFEFQEPTIGAAFLTQTVTLDETTVKFEIWDTAGQGKFHIVLFSNCVNIWLYPNCIVFHRLFITHITFLSFFFYLQQLYGKKPKKLNEPLFILSTKLISTSIQYHLFANPLIYILIIKTTTL